jgi:hypothetical protein
MRTEIATHLSGARNDILYVCNCEGRDSSLMLRNMIRNLDSTCLCEADFSQPKQSRRGYFMRNEIATHLSGARNDLPKP